MASAMSPGERLRQFRKAAGMSAKELGRRAAMVLGRDRPLSEATVLNQETGINGISKDQAEAYARVLKVDPAAILFGPETTGPVASRPQGLRMVGVLGEVRAGAWAELPEQGEGPTEFVPVALPEYERAHLFALHVAGRSMDRHYPDGSVVIVCPAHEAGIREGDHVVVRRQRGGLYETTLKEIVSEPGGVALWPRSTDPAHQEPIRLQSVRDAQEGPEIIGVVVGSFQTRGARSGPLVL